MTKLGRPNKLTHPWSELAEKLGGVAELADEFGVDVATIRRNSAKSYDQMTGQMKKLLGIMCDKHGVKK